MTADQITYEDDSPTDDTGHPGWYDGEGWYFRALINNCLVISGPYDSEAEAAADLLAVRTRMVKAIPPKPPRPATVVVREGYNP